VATTLLDRTIGNCIISVQWSHDYWANATGQPVRARFQVMRKGGDTVYEALVLNLLILIGFVGRKARPQAESKA
jgi:hypothetical protein